MKFGLTKKEIDSICAILQKHPNITQVIIFGSRATNKHKKASDIDLALKGNIDLDTLAKVKYQLEEETNLPYFFDIVDYNNLHNKELKDQIDKYGKIFYTYDRLTLNDPSIIKKKKGK